MQLRKFGLLLVLVLLLRPGYAQSTDVPTPETLTPLAPAPTPDTMTWAVAPVLAQDVYIGGVHLTQGPTPRVQLLCNTSFLKGGRHFPWEARCNLTVSLNISHAFTSGSSSSEWAISHAVWDLYYNVQVPRTFKWSSRALDPTSSPPSELSGSSLASTMKIEATWSLLNASSVFWCEAAVALKISGYDDSAWFPYTMDLQGVVNATCQSQDPAQIAPLSIFNHALAAKLSGHRLPLSFLLVVILLVFQC